MDNRLGVALFQKGLGLGEPAGASAGFPVGAGIGKSAQVLDGMVEVDELKDARREQGAIGDQGLEPDPDPRRGVGDEQDFVGVAEGEGAQVMAQEQEDGIGAIEGAVDDGAEFLVWGAVRSVAADV